MKLTNEQKLEKQARDNIKRLINRVSSEYSFKKWRTLKGYLHSIGTDQKVIDNTTDRELTRAELDELLRQYEEAAFKVLTKASNSIIKGQQENSVQSSENRIGTADNISSDVSIKSEVRINKEAERVDEKFTEKNNYGLSKSKKENITLFWFQKLAAANLLKGFDIK